ncbi:uncharacterized protein MELLADRAFT_89848 [Melampsora larici-populina 98AG31]|uniref:Uncharacterized protein n=1 Tax=Melampsora larici-populina (strain 98AG31 / pathotype 3-4-7) TaxID=747676 RepID=F4RUU5_MELLP|nr:uncharacterized protein MELLADRAFT_89848 [Melampsora larici-populina 98AG31]EGG03757.1 hypothetical protein MELLADRAFT_89848 [Melampsora larici-populina 98AG31]
MSEPNRIEDNLVKFNKHVKRTSERLANRAGSVPLDDRSNVVMPDLPTPDPNATRPTSARGRGRNRGKKSSTVNTRSNAAARNAAAASSSAENATDNTTEKSTNDGQVDPNTSNATAEGNASQAHEADTSQPTGLIERDDVSTNATPQRSTITKTGLTLTRLPDSTALDNNLAVIDGSAHLRAQVNAISGVGTTSAKSTPAPSQPKRRVVGFVELVKDDVAEKSTSAETTVDKETKVVCDEEGIDSNGLVALSPWFDTKMVALKGYLPLSIFNTQWLHQDLIQHSFRRRTTKEKLEDSYVGFAVPVEWKMSFSEWVVAFDLYVTYLRHYTHDDLAKKMMVHKQNVLDIMKENVNWPMAFRYDIAICTTVLTIRNASGNLANPAVRNVTIERQCFRDTERYNDFLPAYSDSNPYATGGPKEHINPLTGEDYRTGAAPQTSAFSANNQQVASLGHNFSFTHAAKPNARSWTHSNQPVYTGPGAVGYNSHGWEDRRTGGRNTRGRGKGGGYLTGGNGGRDQSPPRWQGESSR